jgi:hypothetical protein
MHRMRDHVVRVGATLLVAGILAAASPPDSKVPVEVPPGMKGGARNISLTPEDVPPPGSCRLWYPDRKPADQPRPGPCGSLTRDVPTGAWVLHRAPDGKRLLRLQ